MNYWRGTPIKCANCQDLPAQLPALFCGSLCAKQYRRRVWMAHRTKQYKMTK